MSHVRKNDVVVLLSGKDRDKRGKVLQIVAKGERVLVEQLNMVKRHLKPTQQNQQGGIVERESPLHVSNVALLCAKCDKPRRAKIQISEAGKKQRVCNKCGDLIEAK